MANGEVVTVEGACNVKKARRRLLVWPAESRKAQVPLSHIWW
jgi:hypothetical protein